MSTPCLRVLSLQRGDIRNAAVDFVISEHIGAMNYDGVSCSFPEYGCSGKNGKGTGNFFQIETPESIVTISHVKKWYDLPRRAFLREKHIDENQCFFFVEWEHERQLRQQAQKAAAGKKQLLITYGDQAVEFLQIGAMHPEQMEWVEMPVNLLNRPFLIVDHDDDDTEAKNASIPMGLKEQFIERLSENAGQ